MMVSYSDSLTRKNSRFARNTLRLPDYKGIFNLELAAGSSASDAWDIEGYQGGVDALGIGGSATGKGAHILNIDDVVKNREQAESEIYRDKVWDAFTDDLYTRLEPGGATVLTGTRWHMDDLIGRCLTQFPERITRLRFPAIAEEDDQLGRQPGEALWPERYPLEKLREIEQTLGPYSWSALYQQHPIPIEGNLFKREWCYPLIQNPPEIVWTVRYWDLAMSDKTSADFTCGVKLGQATDGHWYVLDVFRQRLDLAELHPTLARVMLNDGGWTAQGIEERGYMSRVIQDLNADHRLHGYSIMPVTIDGKKYVRAMAPAARLAAGLMHIIHAHWSEAFIEELLMFRGEEGKQEHDDQVDALSGAWAMADDASIGAGQMTYG